jgi:hypothetical protein
VARREATQEHRAAIPGPVPVAEALARREATPEQRAAVPELLPVAQALGQQAANRPGTLLPTALMR